MDWLQYLPYVRLITRQSKFFEKKFFCQMTKSRRTFDARQKDFEQSSLLMNNYFINWQLESSFNTTTSWYKTCILSKMFFFSPFKLISVFLIVNTSRMDQCTDSRTRFSLFVSDNSPCWLRRQRGKCCTYLVRSLVCRVSDPAKSDLVERLCDYCDVGSLLEVLFCLNRCRKCVCIGKRA